MFVECASEFLVHGTLPGLELCYPLPLFSVVILATRLIRVAFLAHTCLYGLARVTIRLHGRLEARRCDTGRILVNGGFWCKGGCRLRLPLDLSVV